MKNKLSQGLIIAALILLTLNAVFIFYSPEDIVNLVGVENSYLTVFLIATFGGLSVFTSGVLYAAIATFSAGGSEPWLIGLVGGIGIGIGDAFIFLLIRYGYSTIKNDTKKKVESYRTYLKNIPIWAQYAIIYIMIGFTPIPNDILLVGLVVLGFSFKKILPLLFMGGVTVATITAYLGKAWFL